MSRRDHLIPHRLPQTRRFVLSLYLHLLLECTLKIFQSSAFISAAHFLYVFIAFDALIIEQFQHFCQSQLMSNLVIMLIDTNQSTHPIILHRLIRASADKELRQSLRRCQSSAFQHAHLATLHPNIRRIQFCFSASNVMIDLCIQHQKRSVVRFHSVFALEFGGPLVAHCHVEYIALHLVVFKHAKDWKLCSDSHIHCMLRVTTVCMQFPVWSAATLCNLKDGDMITWKCPKPTLIRHFLKIFA
mmetsp:Transcript_48004/g.76903  ORF Transcript_48004/g.76903 Transcript_48004/m.76903 type:complete len:244 (+) Transcript_48004:80-811(+)